jgi:hypothetical protein
VFQCNEHAAEIGRRDRRRGERIACSHPNQFDQSNVLPEPPVPNTGARRSQPSRGHARKGGTERTVTLGGKKLAALGASHVNRTSLDTLYWSTIDSHWEFPNWILGLSLIQTDILRCPKHKSTVHLQFITNYNCSLGRLR